MCCDESKYKIGLAVSLVLLGIIIAFNFPELRRYLRISRM